MTERVDSVGNLEEEEIDPRVKEVGSRNGGIFISIDTYDYRVTNIIGLSVCGILFYLQRFRYTNKQLEPKSYKICLCLLAEFCRHTNCSQDFKMSA